MILRNFQFIILLATSIFLPNDLQAQDSAPLEPRVQALEEYVDTIPPTLEEFSNRLQEGVNGYTQGLEDNLKDYSGRLQLKLEKRFEGLDYRTVILDPQANAFHRIDTNVGTFLISVEKTESIDQGVRLYLNIGNPSFADYSHFKLRLFWSENPLPEDPTLYEEWKKSLVGKEYIFKDTLVKGTWNPFQVNLVPLSSKIGYIECQMEVLSVELPFKGETGG